MEQADKLPEDPHTNIPHMHLFLDLKRGFPQLRDSHITDCIQRFGLNKDRCVEELSRIKMQEQHRGYYSPWGGQSRTGSQSSTGGPNSPLSPSANNLESNAIHCGSTPMPPGNIAYPTSPQHEFFVGDINPYSVTTQAVTNYSQPHALQPKPLLPNTSYSPLRNHNVKPVYSSASNFSPSTTDMYFQPIHRPVYNQPPAQAQHLSPSKENQISNLVPKSAPVRHGSSDPFVYEQPTRRSSAETYAEQRRRAMGHSHDSEMVQLQIERKAKLQLELTRQHKEKAKLEKEVETLKLELQNKELIQKTDVEKLKKKTEDIQQDNIRIQSECYEMIREILDLGESPQTEEDLSPIRPLLSPQAASSFGDSIPQSSTLNRASSGSSIGSGFASPPTTHINPQRAPSPPPYIIHQSPNTSPGMARPPPILPTQRMNDHHPPGAATGAGAPKEDNDRQWSCPKCTFKNSSFLNECEMCGMPHLSVGMASPQAQHAFMAGASNCHNSSMPHHAGGNGPCYCHRHNFTIGRDTHGAVRDI